MKIAILGYGKEGKAAEAYFQSHLDEQGQKNEIVVISPFSPTNAEEIARLLEQDFDLIVRSPSVPPLQFWATGEQQGSDAESTTRLNKDAEQGLDAEKNTRLLDDLDAEDNTRPLDDFVALEPKMTSGTRYFFAHCPAPIIGVTGTKGKGTTCSMIAEILRALDKKVFLLGNIGVPALSELDKITKNDVVVYELSSFQLWDMTQSPHIAVLLRIEPDHLNVHKDFADYVEAKGRIAEFQGSEDAIVYFRNNETSAQEAEKSQGQKNPYPILETEVKEYEKLRKVLDALTVPGEHNRENAEAALLAVAAYSGVTLDELLEHDFDKLQEALHNFKGLPHHIEFVRELNGVEYYDDSFATNFPSLEVALKSFADRPLILIAGGQDKKVDYEPFKCVIFSAKNLEKAVLLGEIKDILAEGAPAAKVIEVETLEEAVKETQKMAEAVAGKATEEVAGKATGKATENMAKTGEKGPVVLLSPGAASLDMFESYYQRGELFQEYVKKLK